MKKTGLLLALLVFTLGMNAHAQKKKKALVDEVSGQGYGMAGCGLGSIVFGDKPGMVQIFAATLNGTGVQTFAISTGTSNCEGLSSSAKQTQFIETNKLALEKDLARGQGENLLALREVMGCKNISFSQDMVSNYRRGFPGSSVSTEDITKLASASCQL